MSLKVTNIRLPVEVPEQELAIHIAEKLGIPAAEVQSFRIIRKSLDARSRQDLRFVYSAEVQVPDESGVLKNLREDSSVQAYSEVPFLDPESGTQPLDERPVVVGSGPAGLLAGYFLALKGYRPLIIERGFPVKERVPEIRHFDKGADFQNENNYLFGEGGAGCFSDGKLTCRLSGPDVQWVLERFVDCGARPSIVYEHRPHLGSNKLPMICRNFRRKIDALGGEFRFECRLEGIDVANGQIQGVMTSSGYLKTSQVILGIGHSARDTYHMLYELGVPLFRKAFQLGLRIEQPQEQVNSHKYGRDEYLSLLGAADYTMITKGKRDLYTFCMCAGGIVMPSISEPKMFCTNGMSNSRHDTGFANSGIMTTIYPEEFGSEHPLAGVELQRKYEAVAFELGEKNYYCPIQRPADFLNDRKTDPGFRYQGTYQRGVVASNLNQVLPPVVISQIQNGLPIMNQKWHGAFLENAVLVGPEMRGSSPIRIDRDRETYQTPGFRGLYPVGEGAGYAGGIVSAAVDGLLSAKKLVAQFAPLGSATV
ncbi:D-amino acid dehydrogenase small subunit [Gimesia alba]|uniref:D-amino acid dehydrogenase small subunit n=1 Tax=Gimesia alba TaxID=2527973 RepID=A0A517RPQ4_9PLAN|nr:NAD(P)-binding protein [Gimesia alba]QDT45845.1 D-amino acid dehydrogenase small subunit [Gimesia alba]